MPHSQGELAVIKPDGIVLSEEGLSSLRTLQVRAGSTMWGLWVTSARGNAHRLTEFVVPAPQAHEAALGAAKHAREPAGYVHHLMLSPIPIGADGLGWLTAFEIEVFLANRPGAIASLLRILKEHGVTILSNETSYAGYARTKFQAFASFTHAGRLFEEHGRVLAATDIDRWPLASPSSVREAQRRFTQYTLFQKSGVFMLGALAALEADILTKDARARERVAAKMSGLGQRAGAGRSRAPAVSSEHGHEVPEPFLADSQVNLGSSPWFLSGFLGANIGRFADRAREYFEIAEFLPGLPPSALNAHLHCWFDRVRNQSFTDPVLAKMDDFLPFPREGAPAEARPMTSTECVSTMRQEIDFQLAHTKLAEETVKDWWARDQLTRLHQLHWDKPVTCRALRTLAFGAVFRSFDLEPLEFTVKAGATSPKKPGSEHVCLEVIDKSESGTKGDLMERALRRASRGFLTGKDGLGGQVFAMVAVSGSEGWARVRCLRPLWHEKFAVRVHVSYAVERLEGGEGPPVPLVGLLHAVCEAVAKAAGNIESMRDDVTLREQTRETGTIDLIVFLDYESEIAESGGFKIDPDRWRTVLSSTIESALKAYATEYEEMQIRSVSQKANWRFVLEVGGSSEVSTDLQGDSYVCVQTLHKHVSKAFPGATTSKRTDSRASEERPMRETITRERKDGWGD